MDAGRLSIIAYSDYACPWCYIGLERIERLQREYPVDVEWRPFELHPETPRSGAHLAGRLGSSARAAAYAQNIIGLARDSGIEMAMPPVVANSHLALEAAEFAREHGGFDAYHHELFSAYFEHGRDLGDADVLCEIARSVGVDDQGLRQALADGCYVAMIDRITATARSDEVLSTPTFVFGGGFRMTGARLRGVRERHVAAAGAAGARGRLRRSLRTDQVAAADSGYAGRSERRKARPAGVTLTVGTAPSRYARRRKPWSTASSQMGRRGHDVRQASMTSA